MPSEAGHQTRRGRLVAHLSMLVFAASIAGSFTFGSWTVPYIGAAPLNAIRFAIATALMGAWVFGARRVAFAWPRAPWRFGINGALTAIYFVTMFVALTMTKPVATSAVYTLVPLMTAVTAYVLVGQRSGLSVLVSLVIAGAGAIWVIFRGDLHALLRFDVGLGEIIYFIGCVAYSFYTPLLRRFNYGENPLVLSFWTLLGTTICISLWGLPDILRTDWLALPPMVWAVIAYLAIFPTALAFFLIQYASVHLPAPKVIAYGYIVPSFVIVLEGTVGHGWVSLSVVAGALLTALALLVLALLPER